MAKFQKRKAISCGHFHITMVFWVISSENGGIKIRPWLASARHRLLYNVKLRSHNEVSLCLSLSFSRSLAAVIRRSDDAFARTEDPKSAWIRSEPGTDSPAHRIRSCLVFLLSHIYRSLSISSLSLYVSVCLLRSLIGISFSVTQLRGLWPENSSLRRAVMDWIVIR